MKIGSIRMKNAGSMHDQASVTVSITGGGGSGAQGNAKVHSSGGRIHGIDVVNPGTGYTTVPTVTLTSTNGVDAAAVAVLIRESGKSTPGDSNF